jgi:hypothetical protein
MPSEVETSVSIQALSLCQQLPRKGFFQRAILWQTSQRQQLLALRGWPPRRVKHSTSASMSLLFKRRLAALFAVALREILDASLPE